MNHKQAIIMITLMLMTSVATAETVEPGPSPALQKEPLKEVMLFGGSGTIGDGVLKALMADTSVKRIHVITRRETDRMKQGASTGRVVVTKHTDYLDYAPIAEQLRGTRAVYWALGTSASNVDDPTYTKIHVEFPVAFLRFWLDSKPGAGRSFHLVTGAGTGKDSWFHWAREKAKAEIQLEKMARGTGLRVIAYRPAFIRPAPERASWWQNTVSPLLGALPVRHIGESMLEVTMRPDEIGHGRILDADSIKAFAAAYRQREGIAE